MITRIFLGLSVVLVALVAYAAFQPPGYVVSRSIVIQAPPAQIFPYLNNQRLAEQWGPWSEVDPEAKMVYSGPEEGVGAKSDWNSSGQLGTGSATILESLPQQRVRIELEYSKPMVMKQISDYILEPEGNGTKVTWRVEGKNGLGGRLACLFMDMDKVVGGMFEKGLSNLKALMEK